MKKSTRQIVSSIFITTLLILILIAVILINKKRIGLNMEQSNKIRLILAGTGHFSSQIFESLILNKFNKTSKSFF